MRYSALLMLIALFTLGLAVPEGPADAQVAASYSLSAAAKVRAPRYETGEIACTRFGCHRIPPGCHSEIEYDWNGLPTGYNKVVCPGR